MTEAKKPTIIETHDYAVLVERPDLNAIMAETASLISLVVSARALPNDVRLRALQAIQSSLETVLRELRRIQSDIER